MARTVRIPDNSLIKELRVGIRSVDVHPVVEDVATLSHGIRPEGREVDVEVLRRFSEIKPGGGGGVIVEGKRRREDVP